MVGSSADNKYLENVITGLDFHPSGEIVATIDRYGVCLISDINTVTYQFHLGMEWSIRGNDNQTIFIKFSESKFCFVDDGGRCRWSSNGSEPILYVKYDRNKLNMMDAEKKTLILANPLQLDLDGNYHEFYDPFSLLSLNDS